MVEKLNNPLYGEAKFYNECLGYSYDNGAKLLVEADIKECCDSDTPDWTLKRDSKWGIYTVVAAVDWGVLGGNTHTVVTIGGLDTQENLRVFFSKKFPVDQDPLSQMDEIVRLLNSVGPAILVCDRGGGSLANSVLRKHFPHLKLYEIEYKAKVSAGMEFNVKSKSWITDRTRALAGVVLDIKSNRLIFPNYKVTKDFGRDLLTLSCEYNDRIRAFQIIRDLNTPDDFAHTLVYLRLGARYFAKSPRAYKHQLSDFIPPNGIQPDNGAGSYDGNYADVV